MDTKKFLVVFVSFCLGLPCAGQITIEECYRKAQANYPLIKQYDLIEKSRDPHPFPSALLPEDVCVWFIF